MRNAQDIYLELLAAWGDEPLDEKAVKEILDEIIKNKMIKPTAIEKDTSGWEKEFDKEFANDFEFEPIEGTNNFQEPQLSLDIKSFISNLLSQQREQMVEEIEKMGEGIEIVDENGGRPYWIGFMTALTEAINKLNKLGD